MEGVLPILMVVATVAACLTAIPAIRHGIDQFGAWLAGDQPHPAADVRLGAFIGVFIAAAVIFP